MKNKTKQTKLKLFRNVFFFLLGHNTKREMWEEYIIIKYFLALGVKKEENEIAGKQTAVAIFYAVFFFFFGI